jgi:predicted O-methyltransferase YrrM
MRRFGHWTPRYVVNRSRLWWYERRNPEAPWLTPEANRLLAGLVAPTATGVEWGSGRSTAWLAKRLSRLVSVESQPEWHGRVAIALARGPNAHVEQRLESLEPRADPTRSPYVCVALEIADGSLGFALVDGEYRDYCALAVLPKLAPGALLVLDNANWYLDRPTHSPASRTGLGPLNERWAEFERQVRGWPQIWTSSGVTDTAIWTRP